VPGAVAKEDFHQAAKSWAQIKHALLAKYLSLFVGKTGKGRGRVYYVDAFAGPGLLDDGTKGSALYAAETAAEPVHRTRQNVLKCINVEADQKTFDKLQAATAEYIKTGHVVNLLGRFEDRRAEILQTIGFAPALFFIDPFGTEGAELASLKALKANRAIREAFVRYDDTRVKRLASWAQSHIAALDEPAKKTAKAFNRRVKELTSVDAIRDWFDREPGARESLINGYIAEARRQKIFHFGIAYPIRNPDTGGHRYFLVHLCDFEDGYTWMANFMAAAEVEYEERQGELKLIGGQQELITVRDLIKAARAGMVDQIVQAMPQVCIIRRWGKGKEIQNRRIYAAFVDEFQWRAGRSEWEAALRRMRDDGWLSLTGLKDADRCTLNVVP
jgi:three-Cys-motif partner protein